jgi:hypothetical protein
MGLGDMEQPNRTPNRETRRADVKALPKDGDELTGLVELDIRAAGQEWSERHGCHAPVRAWRGSQLSIQEYIAIGSAPIVIARLSVRRHDGKPLHKHWGTLYRIKTMLYPEHEAVEIHPSSDKLIDDAPMYHLWILEANCTVGCNLGH